MAIRNKIQDDRKTKTLHVDSWGVDVTIKEMAWKDYAAFNNAQSKARSRGESLDPEATLSVLIGCCFDPNDGSKAFTEDDRDWLNDRNPDTIAELVAEIMELSVDDTKKKQSDGSKPI